MILTQFLAPDADVFYFTVLSFHAVSCFNLIYNMYIREFVSIEVCSSPNPPDEKASQLDSRIALNIRLGDKVFVHPNAKQKWSVYLLISVSSGGIGECHGQRMGEWQELELEAQLLPLEALLRFQRRGATEHSLTHTHTHNLQSNNK